MRFSLRFARCFPVMPTIAAALLVFATTGCEERAEAADAPAEASAKEASKPAPAKAESKRKTHRVTSHVLDRAKKKQGYSIDLPEGVKDVSESPIMREYRRGADEFDGYAFSIGIDPRPRPLEMEVARFAAQAKQNPAKKIEVLGSGELDGGGWYVAASFEEGGKRNVTLMSNLTRGDGAPVFMCRGDASGPVIADEKAAVEVLRETCDSLALQ